MGTASFFFPSFFFFFKVAIRKKKKVEKNKGKKEEREGERRRKRRVKDSRKQKMTQRLLSSRDKISGNHMNRGSMNVATEKSGWWAWSEAKRTQAIEQFAEYPDYESLEQIISYLLHGRVFPRNTSAFPSKVKKKKNKKNFKEKKKKGKKKSKEKTFFFIKNENKNRK